MEKFVAKHTAAIRDVSCFDRMPFKGHLCLRYPRAIEQLLEVSGVLFKNFKPFVLRQADRIKRMRLK